MIFCLLSRRMAERSLCRTVLRRFKTILGLLTVGGALASGIVAAEKTSLRVGFETSSDPMSFVRADGKIDGFAVDLVDAIAREMNFTVQPVVGPWDEVF